MHLTSTNVWCVAIVNMPIGRLTWKVWSRRYSDGAYGEKGFDSLDLGCRLVVSLATYLGPVWSEPSSARLIILVYNDHGG